MFVSAGEEANQEVGSFVERQAGLTVCKGHSWALGQGSRDSRKAAAAEVPLVDCILASSSLTL
jgi:hypothetical protein